MKQSIVYRIGNMKFFVTSLSTYVEVGKKISLKKYNMVITKGA